MKIIVNGLFLTQKITGVQRFAIEMSRELKKYFNDKIKFVAPKNIIHKELAEELEVKEIGRFSGLLWEQIDLPYYLSKNNNPLLLNMRNTAPFFYKKNIIVLHDLIFFKNKKWFSKRFPDFYRLCAPSLYRNALKIITVSDYSKQDIINTFEISYSKVTVVNNAVAKEFYKYKNRHFEKKYGDYILTVASLLSPRKNLVNTIKAFNLLNLKNTGLIVVGAESEHFSDEKMLKEVKLNENIILTGYVSDEELAILYKYAKLLVFPSFYEGFGIPPIEAMYFGCPVIVSSFASLPEVCGDAALYVNPYDVDDIAKGIERVLNDQELKNKLIAKGYQRQTKFNWEDSAHKMIEVIKTVYEKEGKL